MSDPDDIQVEHSEGKITLSGKLDADTASRALECSTDWFNQDNTLCIDLSGVDRSDSAGVALLLEWQRRAEAAELELHYLNLPRQMQAIVRFCRLEDVLVLG